MKLWPFIKPADAPPPVDAPEFPGTPEALDGSAAVVEMETAASEAAGAYPITPSTQMGEGWAVAVAEGRRNVNGRRLLFFEPEGETCPCLGLRTPAMRRKSVVLPLPLGPMIAVGWWSAIDS